MRDWLRGDVSLIQRLTGAPKIARVALIRHFETSLNVTGVVDGISASGLTSRGGLQAQALRRYFMATAPQWLDPAQTRWVVSSLERARESASAMMPGKEFLVSDDFCEVDVGALQGKRWADAIHDRILPADHHARSRFPSGESYEMAQARAMGALERLLAEEKDDLVVMTHGGIVALLILGIFGISLDAFPFSEIDNGSCTIVEFHYFKSGIAPKIGRINFVPPIDNNE